MAVSSIAVGHVGQDGCASLRAGEKALDEQGIEYEVVKGPLRPGKRNEFKALRAAQYPTIEFGDGSTFREESKDMAARSAPAPPFASSFLPDQHPAPRPVARLRARISICSTATVAAQPERGAPAGQKAASSCTTGSSSSRSGATAWARGWRDQRQQRLVVRESRENIGATIMGRKMFGGGPPGGQYLEGLVGGRSALSSPGLRPHPP